MAGGHRSMGCERCRARKIRCDQQRPACSACIKSKLQCRGYPGPFAFDVQTQETYQQKRKARKRPSSAKDAAGSTGPSSDYKRSYRRPGDAAEHGAEWRHSSRALATRTPSCASSITTGTSDSELSHTPDEAYVKLPVVSPSNLDLDSPAMNRMAAVGAMQRGFVPNIAPNITKGSSELRFNDRGGSGLWLSAALLVLESKHSPLLEDALLAMSVAFLARIPEVPLHKSHGQFVYARTLRRLQYEINTLDVSKEWDRLDACLMASFACAWYEMLAGCSLENMRTHMAGMGALLRQLGIKRLRTRAAHVILAEYRMTDIWTCLRTRNASFLCSEEWYYQSWCPDLEKPSRMQMLLDVAFAIPPIMVALDKASQANPEEPNDELESCAQQQLTKVTMIENGVGIWTQKTVSTGDWKASQWQKEGLYFAYDNSTEGLAWMYFFAIKLIILKLFIDTKKILIRRGVYGAHLLETEILQHRAEFVTNAEAIFSSVEYFFEPEQGLAGPAVCMVPFLVAYKYAAEALMAGNKTPELGRRIAWCAVVTKRFVDLGFPL